MQKRTRDFWVKLVQQFPQSGTTQAAFAAQHGVSPKTLSYWLKRLHHAPQEAPAFVPVCVADAPAPPKKAPQTRTRPGALEAVLPDGLRLCFTPGTSSGYIARVLGPLRASRC